jgi:hypothetical protein
VTGTMSGGSRCVSVTAETLAAPPPAGRSAGRAAATTGVTTMDETAVDVDVVVVVIGEVTGMLKSGPTKLLSSLDEQFRI